MNNAVPDDAEPMPCAICGRPTRPGRRYLVRVQVLADPAIDNEMPDQSYEDLVRELEAQSADEAQDSVFRHYEYVICLACQPRMLANPLGLPRVHRESRN